MTTTRLFQDLEMNVGVFLPSHLIEWLENDDGQMGVDNNNIWDWDSNNNK